MQYKLGRALYQGQSPKHPMAASYTIQNCDSFSSLIVNLWLRQKLGEEELANGLEWQEIGRQNRTPLE